MARRISPASKIAWTAIAWIIGFVVFFPILWMVITSFKTELEAFRPTFIFEPTTEQYQAVLEQRDYPKFAMNSIFLAGGSTLLALLIAIPSAWGMAFSPTKRTKDLVIWMLFTYFKEIPKDILEAARMDGATTWKEIVFVLTPMAVPGIASTVLLNVILAWNEAFWTLNLTTIDAAPLTQFIASFSAPQGNFWAKLSAASTLAIAPIVILGWFGQRQLVRGLTFGAVK